MKIKIVVHYPRCKRNLTRW